MLVAEQEINLVRFIAEDFGNDLDHEEFIDRCLQMFEDIAGLECLNDEQTESVTTRLWRLYDQQRSQIGTGTK